MAGQADLKARRVAVRSGRMRGVRLQIPSEALVEAGVPISDAPLWYSITPGRSEKRGRIIITFYDRAQPAPRVRKVRP